LQRPDTPRLGGVAAPQNDEGGDMKLLATLSLALAGLLAGAVAAPAPAAPARSPGVAYAGETSQDSPVSFVLSRDRKTIKRLDIDWYATLTQCTNGVAYVSGNTFGAAKTKALKLSSRGTFRQTYVDALTVAGVAHVEERPVVRGTVGRTRASGTFRATVIVTDAAGAEINRCDTGTIRWRAVQ
jgi:hypothetical protein